MSLNWRILIVIIIQLLFFVALWYFVNLDKQLIIPIQLSWHTWEGDGAVEMGIYLYSLIQALGALATMIAVQFTIRNLFKSN